MGDGDFGVETRVRNENARVVEHAHSINSVKNERRLNICLAIAREALNSHRRLSLAHIPGTIIISDELGKSTSQVKLITLLRSNILHTVSVRSKDGLRRRRHADKQYLASHLTNRLGRSWTHSPDGARVWIVAR